MSTSTLTTAIPERYALPTLPKIPGTDPERSPLDGFKIATAQLVAQAWDLDVAKVYAGVDTGKKGADLSVAIARFKKGNPQEWAEKIQAAFQPSNALSTLTVEGAFLLFKLNKESFAYHILRRINLGAAAAQENQSSFTEAFGTTTEGDGKHLLVDYSSPNIAKPFHAGHLRSTIIGEVICNLHEAHGWKVTRLNYLGDWGTQYGLLSLGFDRYGSEEELIADPIKHLFKVYVEINKAREDEIARIAAGEVIPEEQTIHAAAKQIFRDMEDDEPKAIAQWSRFRELSIEKLKEVYAKLNIKFDVYWGESQVSKESMDRAIKILQEKKITVEDKGALLVDLTKYKLDKGIIRKADGTTIYLTRDLGGAYDKWLKYKFDKHIYVVQTAQSLHFKQLYKTLELMDEEFAGRMEHVSFGLVTGMSTRKGTVVFLDDILDEAKTSMHEAMESNEAKYAQVEDPEMTSREVGTTAVKIQDLSGKRINDYGFNMKRCTSFQGDFGPFIQYSHVRLCSVQRKNPNVLAPSTVDQVDLSLLNDPKVDEIIYHLSQYPTVLKTAYTLSEPSAIVTWSFKLSHLVGSAWETLKVSGAEEETAKARLFLFVCTRDVLAAAMRMLSLTPIERM